MSSIYLSNAIFMMIILTIIFLRIRYYITWSPSKKYTMIFIGMVELYVLMDALFMKELLGKSGNFLQFKLVVFFFYLVYVIMPYVWHLFMQSYMGINRSKKQKFAEMIPFILLVLMVLLSVPTGIVWRFSRNRTYIRGTFFGVFAVLNLFYYVYTFAQTFFILFMNNTKGVRYLIKSALFSAVPLIGILANTYIIPLYGAYPFQPYCLVIGALLSYLFMVEHQQDQMEFEHRKRLSKALELEKESTRKAKVELCMCSFRDKIYLGFTSRYDCDAIKENFFQILKEQEVKTEILKVEYPESVMTEAKGMQIFKIFTFLCMIAIVAALGVDYSIDTNLHLSLFVCGGAFSMWLALAVGFFKRYNLLKNAMWQLIIVTVGCIIWDWLTGWHGWSIDFVLPGVSGLIMISMLIISRVYYRQAKDYLVYFVMAALYGMILPFIFLLTGKVRIVFPSVISIGMGVLMLIGLVLFKGKEMRQEMEKNLHV